MFGYAFRNSSVVWPFPTACVHHNHPALLGAKLVEYVGGSHRYTRTCHAFVETLHPLRMQQEQIEELNVVRAHGVCEGCILRIRRAFEAILVGERGVLRHCEVDVVPLMFSIRLRRFVRPQAGQRRVHVGAFVHLL